jgi:hypothetical protein
MRTARQHPSRIARSESGSDGPDLQARDVDHCSICTRILIAAIAAIGDTGARAENTGGDMLEIGISDGIAPPGVKPTRLTARKLVPNRKRRNPQELRDTRARRHAGHAARLWSPTGCCRIIRRSSDCRRRFSAAAARSVAGAVERGGARRERTDFDAARTGAARRVFSATANPRAAGPSLRRRCRRSRVCPGSLCACPPAVDRRWRMARDQESVPSAS